MKEFDHKITKLFSQFEVTSFSNMGNKTPYFFIKLKDMKSHNKLIQLPVSFKSPIRRQNSLKSL